MKKKDLNKIGSREMPKSPASHIITYGQGGDSKKRIGGSESSQPLPKQNLVPDGSGKK